MQSVIRLGCDINVGDRTEVSDKRARKQTFGDKTYTYTEQLRKGWCEGEEESLGWDMPKLRAGESRKGNVQEDSYHTEASILPTPGFVS